MRLFIASKRTASFFFFFLEQHCYQKLQTNNFRTTMLHTSQHLFERSKTNEENFALPFLSFFFDFNSYVLDRENRTKKNKKKTLVLLRCKLIIYHSFSFILIYLIWIAVK